jgi:branched-chain amino acid transport system substrate-binding protein
LFRQASSSSTVTPVRSRLFGLVDPSRRGLWGRQHPDDEPASGAPNVTDDAAKNGYTTILRLYGRDDAQGRFIRPWIKEEYGAKKIVILHDKSAYGKGLAAMVKEDLNKAGMKRVLYEGLNASAKGYTAVVNR